MYNTIIKLTNQHKPQQPQNKVKQTNKLNHQHEAKEHSRNSQTK